MSGLTTAELLYLLVQDDPVAEVESRHKHPLEYRWVNYGYRRTSPAEAKRELADELARRIDRRD